MPKAINIPKEVLVDLYINQRKTIKEVCEEIGVRSPITVAKYLKKYNIPVRDLNKIRQKETFGNKTHEEFLDYLRDLYINQKKSICQISKIIGRTPRIVKKYLNEAGVRTLKHKEANRFFNSMERCNNWKGGKIILNGYIAIYMPNHPYRTAGDYVYEHRLIMEQHLNRYLESWEIVHHINGDKMDNRLENLEILDNVTHRKKHFEETNAKLGVNNYLNAYKKLAEYSRTNA